ncbi:peptide/nickel transport system permease protein [Ferrithrix thermotolerans DSM 19514]|uniref:Peptide/nickel transport system permease protein n=1 Tax=Ferrithrix thermotolerans DSM 19514 TaxID=1121881 RepID=A0A1M4XS27_9ACTN|nr:ABC transporter permease [Ferrithrix thermotolerans]SHE96384.1 peptide/nickel transport system permease protein [Ferrithrix thermotolerans DSM 19514]
MAIVRHLAKDSAKFSKTAPIRKRASRSLTKVVLRLVATLFLASLVDFLVINVLPGSPGQVILGTQATPQRVAELNKKLGLDAPLFHQYITWVTGLLTLNFGRSYSSGARVAPDIRQALQITLPLIVGGLVLGIAMALPLAFLIYRTSKTRISIGITLFLDAGVSTPSFIIGLVLTYIFAVRYTLLPASGFTFWSTSISGAIKSLIMPALSLGLVEAAIISRYAKHLIEEVMNTPYVDAARLRGRRDTWIFLHHGLRNITAPLLTVIGLEASGLLVGAVVVENVFGLPGLGTLLLNAVENRDLILVQDIVMLAVTVVTTINLLVDLSYRHIQPQLRQEIL